MLSTNTSGVGWTDAAEFLRRLRSICRGAPVESIRRAWMPHILSSAKCNFDAIQFNHFKLDFFFFFQTSCCEVQTTVGCHVCLCESASFKMLVRRKNSISSFTRAVRHTVTIPNSDHGQLIWARIKAVATLTASPRPVSLALHLIGLSLMLSRKKQVFGIQIRCTAFRCDSETSKWKSFFYCWPFSLMCRSSESARVSSVFEPHWGYVAKWQSHQIKCFHCPSLLL